MKFQEGSIKPRSRSILVVLYVIYVAFILVSAVPYLAEQETRGKLQNGVYESHLTFPENGEYGHYTIVVLSNTDIPGRIDLTYTFATNTLNIEKCDNIVELTIDCKLMYENKALEVFEDDPSNLGAEYYKDYFIETNDGIFTINVNTDTKMTKLVFKNTPLPYSVTVDSTEWWKTNTHYTVSNNDVTITEVPKGSSKVIIYFQAPDNELPTATFTIDPATQFENQDVSFDASASSDPDGTISDYLWEFGDGTTGSGVTTTHKYTTADTYTVTLKVRDDQNGENTLSKDVTIIEEGAGDPPTADFSMSKTQGTVGETITFDASGSTDPDGSIVSYTWDFGDGQTGTGETATHKYTTAKTYTVELTVKDDTGFEGTAQTTIVIKDAPVEEDDDEEESMFGLGKVAGIDLFWLLLIILIVVIMVIAGAAAARKKKPEEELPPEAPPVPPEAAGLPAEMPPAEIPPAYPPEGAAPPPSPGYEEPMAPPPMEEAVAPYEAPPTEEIPPTEEMPPTEEGVPPEEGGLPSEEAELPEEELPDEELPSEELPAEEPPAEEPPAEEPPAEGEAAAEPEGEEGGEEAAGAEMTACPACGTQIPIGVAACPNCNSEFEW